MEKSSRIYLRRVVAGDSFEFIELMKKSISIHYPWITPPHNTNLFKAYLNRIKKEDHEGFAVCEKTTEEIVGVININNIIRGSFQSGSLGYYVGEPYTGQGFMKEGLNALLTLAFNTFGLHRLEANIQSENHKSIALVKRCGFVKEGLSTDFLFIDGSWKDHERWCAVDNRRALRKR
jgi:ribosomal-protein-alanine N-acetyltransferase